MPVATTALNSRAPSRCVSRPLACAQRQIDFDDLVRLDPAAAAVVRVLQADQPRAHQVLVVAADQSGQLLEPQDAVVAVDRAGRHAAELGVGALLVVVDVAADSRR